MAEHTEMSPMEWFEQHSELAKIIREEEAKRENFKRDPEFLRLSQMEKTKGGRS